MKEKKLYILIGVLVTILVLGISYIIYNKNKPINDVNNLQDGVKQKKVYKSNDSIIEEVEVILNGVIKNLKIEYTYQYDSDSSRNYVTGNFKGTTLYSRNEKDKYYDENNNIIEEYSKDNIFTINVIKNKFDDNNYKIIKGNDGKNYLIVLMVNEDKYSKEYYAYVFNEDLKLINKEDNNPFKVTTSEYNVIVEATNLSWYENDYCANNDIWCHTIFKIENNKIYFLDFKFNENYSDGNYGVLEEKVYTLNTGKLEYEIINTYKVTKMENMID